MALSILTLAIGIALAPLAGLPAPPPEALEPAAKVLVVGVNGGLLASRSPSWPAPSAAISRPSPG